MRLSHPLVAAIWLRLGCSVGPKCRRRIHHIYLNAMNPTAAIELVEGQARKE